MSEDQGSAEERAEELMERLAAQGTQAVSRFVGRAREEIEDIVAEARTLHEGNGSAPQSSAGRSPSGN